MSIRLASLLLAICSCSSIRVASADDVRYYEDNGITYRETKRTVQRPISETHYEDRQQTVYVQQYKSQPQTLQRVTQVPITDYVWEPYWVNRYNPFAQAYIAYRYVPRTRWEARTEQVQMPTLQREVVPQQQTVKVPVTTQRMASEEQITRVAIASKPANGFTQPNTAVAQNTVAPNPINNPAAANMAASGGARLDSDPPRGATAWRPGDLAPVQR